MSICYCLAVEKQFSNFILSLAILSSVFLVFFPYFTSSFLDLRQKTENGINYQKFLKEQETIKEAEKEAQQKIYLTGKFDPAQREDFVLIPAQYTLGQMNQNKMYLRKKAYEAFLKMKDVADKDEIDLKIASATRNFDYQKNIWNNKWSGVTIVDGQDLSITIPNGLERFRKILEYSAVPGTSRHHWGTEIDINGSIPLYFNEGKGEKEYEWLAKNAYLFGFCQSYNLKGSNRPTGYNEERWHWSYLPLARIFMQEYKDLTEDEDIKGFDGDEYVPSLNLINDYVLSINPDCI